VLLLELGQHLGRDLALDDVVLVPEPLEQLLLLHERARIVTVSEVSVLGGQALWNQRFVVFLSPIGRVYQEVVDHVVIDEHDSAPEMFILLIQREYFLSMDAIVRSGRGYTIAGIREEAQIGQWVNAGTVYALVSNETRSRILLVHTRRMERAIRNVISFVDARIAVRADHRRRQERDSELVNHELALKLDPVHMFAVVGNMKWCRRLLLCQIQLEHISHRAGHRLDYGVDQDAIGC
jgi:hypothetical protein